MKILCLIVLISTVCATQATSQGGYDDQQPQPVENCAYPEIYAPVCGSDGVTYENKYALECAQKTNPDLYIVSQSACPKESQESDEPYD